VRRQSGRYAMEKDIQINLVSYRFILRSLQVS
jgi:hypothetical protein